jgi:fructuronate reductase
MLIGIPLAIAGWLRYLLGADDSLEPMPLSGDPLMGGLSAALSGIDPSDRASYAGQLQPILSNPKLFGVNLAEAGLGQRIEALFTEMLGGKGAVRRAIRKALGD